MLSEEFGGDEGQVFGIDVGWSPKRPTTGLCALRWTGTKIDYEIAKIGVGTSERSSEMRRLAGTQEIGTVGIDGPLAPDLLLLSEYRAAEALLSAGSFQRRGKPGPTNGGSGPRLHQEATALAQIALATLSISPAQQPLPIHDLAIVEAFPNLFLAVLHPESAFPVRPQKSRRWTDTLWPRVCSQIEALLAALLPGRKLTKSLDRVQGHEEIAALVCALTALCVAKLQYVAVGDIQGGTIMLPPLNFWGFSTAGERRWAWSTLSQNLDRVRRRFPDASIWINGVRSTENT